MGISRQRYHVLLLREYKMVATRLATIERMMKALASELRELESREPSQHKSAEAPRRSRGSSSVVTDA